MSTSSINPISEIVEDELGLEQFNQAEISESQISASVLALGETVVAQAEPVLKNIHAASVNRAKRIIWENTEADEQDRDFDVLGRYLKDIGRHALLTKDDEIALAQTIEEGRDAAIRLGMDDPDLSLLQYRHEQKKALAGECAKETFVNANLRLVVSIARRYRRAEVPLLDIIQEGNIGMMHAVEKFDWRKGFKFSTYATWWIQQAITRALPALKTGIRLPVHVNDDATALARAEERFYEAGRYPSDDDLAEATGMSRGKIKKVREAMTTAWRLASLNDKVGEKGEIELEEMIGDPDSSLGYRSVEDTIFTDQLIELAKRVLSENEYKIVSLRYGLGGSTPLLLKDVAAIMDMTSERARQIEGRALAKLRHPVTANKFDLRSLL